MHPIQDSGDVSVHGSRKQEVTNIPHRGNGRPKNGVTRAKIREWLIDKPSLANHIPVGVSTETISQILRAMPDAYICDWIPYRYGYLAKWAIGDKPHAPKPDSRTTDENELRKNKEEQIDEARLKKPYFANAQRITIGGVTI